MSQAKHGADHPLTLDLRMLLAGAYESVGRCSDAERLERDTLERRRKTSTPKSPLVAGDLAALGRNLLASSRWSEAEPVLRECLKIRVKETPDDWQRYDAMSLTGAALLGQGLYAEAEPLLLGGLAGIEARKVRVPVPEAFRLRDAAERVVRLYEEWGMPEKATQWKAKLDLGDLPAEIFARP